MTAALEPLIYEISRPGRKAYSLPALDVPEAELPQDAVRDPEQLGLPEVSELDVVRHFTHLSRFNHAIDVGFYPLGSCTMKYNPKLNEDVARLPGFTDIHPLQPEETVQGALQLQYELQKALANISGFDAVTLQPAAGAQGELVGVLTIRAYHQARGDKQRTKILVPDAAHGTNPATAAMCGFQVVTIKSDKRGNVDLEHLRQMAGPDTAGLMLTNPNTLGLFDENLLEVTEIVHKAGGLMYGDGANFNAILGVVRPGDVGFDVMHINLHKTFSTPHGGGGPGSGPVCVKEHLAPYLPTPVVDKEEKDGQTRYFFRELPETVGKVRSFWGNFGMHVRAYTYIRVHGAEGLRAVSENAVLNANYLMNRLRGTYEVAYDRTCMHEFVLTGKPQKQKYGVKTLDIAKRLLDFGYHSPTIYFPLIVEEAIMIEPTETESKTTLDQFAETMLQIAREAEEQPELVKNAPYTTPVVRLDETTAARKPQIRFRCF
ncbi:MAG TPA: aminomethyl-transferring glycine dehydrogenase subunit GcvPB [Chloroflexia bacterium]|nr:aminomethyl-transferring glycine dehydrogenase subunit GcvPB [Chloroflexia bacterium]